MTKNWSIFTIYIPLDWKCYSVDLKNKTDLDSLANVDIYYEKWVKECAESSKHSDFQKLWEVLMIRVTSEAICETAGSMMNQHCGKNRFLQPENFNIEMYIKFNLGPLHLLNNFVKEILASDSSQSYLRKVQAMTMKLVTNDLSKRLLWKPSNKDWKKSLVFQHHSGKIILSKVYYCVVCEKSTKLFCFWKLNTVHALDLKPLLIINRGF